MAGLLDGIRVVETGVLMGVDNLGRLLGDEGADVVKVESPQVGDYLRDIIIRFAPGWSVFHLTLSRPTLGVVIGPLHAAFGVAAALARRARTGEGCYLDVSCADAVLAAGWLDALPALNPELIDPEGPQPGPMDSAKYQHYATEDGKFVLFCAIEAKFWDHFCRAVDREDLL